MKDYFPAELDTLALHAGGKPDPTTGACDADLSNSVLLLSDSDYAAALFNMERPGHVYSRLSNPTTAVLEERIARLRAVSARSRLPAARRRFSSPS